MIVWLNGRLVTEEEACIAPSDRGLLLGDGLFETIGVSQGRALFEREHFARLAHGAAALGIDLPCDPDRLQEAISSLLAANGLDQAPRAALRLTLTRGPGPRGLLPPEKTEPTLLIACFPSPPPQQSATAIVTTIRRNEFSPAAALKALPYLDQVMARREAQAAGADAAIFLNTRGKIACATAANIFLWDSDTLITPPLSDGCLAGIARAAVMDVAQREGVALFEESVTPSTLANVQAAFLTNSLIGLQTLSAIDGRVLDEHRLMAPLRTAFERAERESRA